MKVYPLNNVRLNSNWSVGGITNGTDTIWYQIRSLFVPNIKQDDILLVSFAEEYLDNNGNQWTIECVDCVMLDEAKSDGSASFGKTSSWLSNVTSGTYNKLTGLPTSGFNLAHPIGRNTQWDAAGHYDCVCYTALWQAQQDYTNGVWVSHWVRFRSSSASPPYSQNQSIQNNGWLQVKRN